MDDGICFFQNSILQLKEMFLTYLIRNCLKVLLQKICSSQFSRRWPGHSIISIYKWQRKLIKENLRKLQIKNFIRRPVKEVDKLGLSWPKAGSKEFLELILKYDLSLTFEAKFEVRVWSQSLKLNFEVEIWSWRNLKQKKFEVKLKKLWLKKFEVDENLKLKKFEVEI